MGWTGETRCVRWAGQKSWPVRVNLRTLQGNEHDTHMRTSRRKRDTSSGLQEWEGPMNWTYIWEEPYKRALLHNYCAISNVISITRKANLWRRRSVISQHPKEGRQGGSQNKRRTAASLSICLEVDLVGLCLWIICVRGIKANKPLIDIIYRPHNTEGYFGRVDECLF